MSTRRRRKTSSRVFTMRSTLMGFCGWVLRKTCLATQAFSKLWIDTRAFSNVMILSHPLHKRFSPKHSLRGCPNRLQRCMTWHWHAETVSASISKRIRNRPSCRALLLHSSGSASMMKFCMRQKPRAAFSGRPKASRVLFSKITSLKACACHFG